MKPLPFKARRPRTGVVSVTCYLLPVPRHLSPVTCHLLPVHHERIPTMHPLTPFTVDTPPCPAPLVRVGFVEALRSWQGTPFHHGAALRGIGCDCYGLIVGAAAAAGAASPALPFYPENPEHITPPQHHAMRDHFLSFGRIIPREHTQDGDIMIFALRDAPVHFAWRLSPDTFLHADRRQGVVVTRYTASWQRRHRISGRLRMIP